MGTATNFCYLLICAYNLQHSETVTKICFRFDPDLLDLKNYKKQFWTKESLMALRPQRSMKI